MLCDETSLVTILRTEGSDVGAATTVANPTAFNEDTRLAIELASNIKITMLRWEQILTQQSACMG